MVGLRLAATGAIKEELLQLDEIAFFVIKYMVKHYGDALKDRFSIEDMPSDTDNPDDVVKVMEAIGRRRGAIVSGGKVDLDKASLIILRDLRAGKMGRFSLEKP
ncbi:Ribosome biogenesis GTPase A [compost metagenome]